MKMNKAMKAKINKMKVNKTELKRIMEEIKLQNFQDKIHYKQIITEFDNRKFEIDVLEKHYQKFFGNVQYKHRKGYWKDYRTIYQELYKVRINDIEFTIYIYNKPEKNNDPIIVGEYRIRFPKTKVNGKWETKEEYKIMKNYIVELIAYAHEAIRGGQKIKKNKIRNRTTSPVWQIGNCH